MLYGAAPFLQQLVISDDRRYADVTTRLSAAVARREQGSIWFCAVYFARFQHYAAQRRKILVRRFKMFQKLKELFQSTPRQPIVPFVDPVLGEFAFDNDLGWKKRIDVGETEAELVIGSDGEIPSDEMVRTARMWVVSWCSEKPRLLEYIRNVLGGWTFEPDIPDPVRFTLESINVLWPDQPNTCMLYLDYPGDEYRAWHITLDGTTPRGFAYND